MAYTPTNWTDNATQANAARLNKLEQGIADAHETADEALAQSGTSGTRLRESVATSTALPTTGNEAGDARITEDTGHFWVWDGTAWVDTGTVAQGPPGADAEVTDTNVAGAIGSETQAVLAAAFDAEYVPVAYTTGRPINARDYGVREDVADIRTALNTAITDNPGGTIVVPPGATYTTKADAGTPSSGKNGGIHIGTAGTTLDLRGATIQMQTSASTHYQIIDVDAPDCRVIGGKLVGDVGSHTGTSGEWGYGISVGANGHRFLADGVRAEKCWGDGFYVWERPQDVVFRSCVGDDNRRQGLSIIDAVRPRIEGGAYINTGKTAFTGPGGGIDLEPDPGTARDVLDAIITGVLLDGNYGEGLIFASTDRTVSATVSGVRVSNNGKLTTGDLGGRSGVRFSGTGLDVSLYGVDAISNDGAGFMVEGWAEGTIRLISTYSARNHRGYLLNAPAVIKDAHAEFNQVNGYYINVSATGTLLQNASGHANAQVQPDAPQFDIWAPDVRLVACMSDGGTLAAKPNYGYVVRGSATGARLIGCDTANFTPGASYTTQATDTVAIPKPGVALPTLASDATAAQIRTALIALGMAK